MELNKRRHSFCTAKNFTSASPMTKTNLRAFTTFSGSGDKFQKPVNGVNGVNHQLMHQINQVVIQQVQTSGMSGNNFVLNHLSNHIVNEIGKDMCTQINTNIIEHVGNNPFGFMYAAFGYFRDFFVDNFRSASTHVTDVTRDMDEANLQHAMAESLKTYRENEREQQIELKHVKRNANSAAKLDRKSLSNNFYRNLIEELAEAKTMSKTSLDSKISKISKSRNSSECSDVYYDAMSDYHSDVDNVDTFFASLDSVETLTPIVLDQIVDQLEKYDITPLTHSMFAYELTFAPPRVTKPVLTSKNRLHKLRKWPRLSYSCTDDICNDNQASHSENTKLCDDVDERSNKLSLNHTRGIDYFIPLTSANVLNSINFDYVRSNSNSSDSDSNSIVFCDDLSTCSDDNSDESDSNVSQSSPSHMCHASRRRRTFSEESDDSFVVFSGDNCMHDEYDESDMDDGDSTLNDSDCAHMSDVVDFSNANKIISSPNKKVQFKDDELCTVHPIIKWNYAYQLARKGPWEEMARDRDRFRLRIARLNSVIAPILTMQHRDRIYKNRFMSRV